MLVGSSHENSVFNILLVYTLSGPCKILFLFQIGCYPKLPYLIISLIYNIFGSLSLAVRVSQGLNLMYAPVQVLLEWGVMVPINIKYV